MKDSLADKVVVTGASGFIGSQLCRYLKNHGVDIVAVSPRAQQKNTTSVTVDLELESLPDEYLEGTRAIVHCAGRAHVTREDSSDPLADYRRMNVEATLRLAEQAARAGVQRFIFLSSIGVNGNYTLSNIHPGSPPVFREDQTPSPHNMYAISKWEAEQGLWHIQQKTGLEVVIIRPPLVYGPGAKGNFATLMKWVKRGVPLPLKNVSNQRSLIALDNLVSFIAACVEHPEAAGEVFVIADGEDISTTDLLRRLAQASGRNARLIPVPAALILRVAKLSGKQSVAESLLGSLKVDASKARNLLGWRPPVKMDEQLRKCFKDM